MKINKAIAKRVLAACRKACGGRRHVEVGEFRWAGLTGNAGFNFLLWPPNADLWESWDIDGLANTDIPDVDGHVALDCYCYTVDDDPELDRNVYVLLNKQGRVVYARDDDMGHSAAIAAIMRGA